MTGRARPVRGATLAFAALAAHAALTGCGGRDEDRNPSSDTDTVAVALDRAVCKEAALVILFDRTTRLSTETGKEAVASLSAYIRDKAVAGQADLLEIGATLFKQRKVASHCLPGLVRDKPKPVSSRWLDDANKRGMDALRAKAASEALERALEASWEQPRARIEVETQNLIAADSETASSEIASAVVEEMGRRCSGKKVCRILILSDMLDTSIEKLRSGGALAGAPSQATMLWETLGPADPPEALFVTAWGVGRDDRDSESTLTLPEVRNVIGYWNAFFKALPVAEKTVSIARGG